MAAQTDGDYTKLLAGFARGSTMVSDLPLEETAFWTALLERVARRRGRSPAARTEAAAEGLLHRPLKSREQAARNKGVIAGLDSASRNVRRLAVSLMHEYATNNELLDAAARAAHDSDFEVRLDAVRLLAKNPSRQTLPALLDVLATANDLRASIASDALVEIGEAAVPGLTRLLSNEDASVRWRAALCLKKIATPETLSGLLRALHDDSPDVAWVAADGLLMLGTPVSVSVLRSVLGQRLNPVTTRALRHYAEHASPVRLFKPIVDATSGTATGSATLLAVEKTLKALEAQA